MFQFFTFLFFSSFYTCECIFAQLSNSLPASDEKKFWRKLWYQKIHLQLWIRGNCYYNEAPVGTYYFFKIIPILCNTNTDLLHIPMDRIFHKIDPFFRILVRIISIFIFLQPQRFGRQRQNCTSSHISSRFYPIGAKYFPKLIPFSGL